MHQQRAEQQQQQQQQQWTDQRLSSGLSSGGAAVVVCLALVPVAFLAREAGFAGIVKNRRWLGAVQRVRTVGGPAVSRVGLVRLGCLARRRVRL